jgi:hypothetical protein
MSETTEIEHAVSVAFLAGIVDKTIREQNQIDGENSHEITRISGLIAHHGARYFRAFGQNLVAYQSEGKKAKARRRIVARVKADMAGSPVASFLLATLISYGVRKLIEWIFVSDGNQKMVARIGRTLPAWGERDETRIAETESDGDYEG